MKIVICDDRQEDRSILHSFVSSYFKEINSTAKIAVFDSGDSLLAGWDSLNPDDVKIAFLDIFMPGTNGIDVAKKLRETDEDMLIIFTTTSTEHLLEGYSVHAYQYLVKPIEYPKVAEILDKCVKRFADSLRIIEVLSDRRTVKVRLRDIMYIESFDKVIYIHTVSETLKCYLPLSMLERQLAGSTFLRTHRSFIVNMSYIDDVRSSDFLLTNGKAIPIGRNGKAEVKQAHMDYLAMLTRGM